MLRSVGPRLRFVVPVLLACAAVPAFVLAASGDKDRPSISVKASPMIAFSPARIVLTADLKGGANDYAQFYCSTVEWDWGDGTVSQESNDCDPYQAGKSEIKRHYTVDRVFQTSGNYRVEFRLKRNDKVIASAGTLVKIQPGVHEIGGGGGR
ncbi:MAG TPA: hypothetical protein VFX12_12030 [Vicinamibacterales bacterium]|nr:hypothetical protein [Vicinamibacterales bacterium]